jgi:transposase
MRGEEHRQPVLFSYVSLEDRVPKSQPLRKLRVLVDGILTSASAEFDAVYSRNGRPSIPPERLLRA